MQAEEHTGNSRPPGERSPGERSSGDSPSGDRSSGASGASGRGTRRAAEEPRGRGRLARLRGGAGLSEPPPGPTRPAFWRSPLRGPWLTSVLGLVLLAGITVLFVTGLLSYAAYNPGLGPPNDKTPDKGWLGFYLFPWPTDPPWLYRLSQGTHVTLGVVLVPVLLAKLWSVVPKLFTWPPVRSLGHALERLSLLLLVGGALFEFATGLLDVQLDYIFPGSFYTLHFYGAWVFIGAFAVHIAFRIPVMTRALRSRDLRAELRTPARRTRPESEAEADETGLVSPDPAPATMSRRGALGMVGAGSLVLFVVTAGQSIGGSLRETAVLAPRHTDPGTGPNGFQINKTARARGIRAADIGDGWRLTVRAGGRQQVLTRQQLLELPQHTAELPIACVEGWSTEDQRWSGVRLAALAGLVGLSEDDPPGVFVESAQRSGSFRSAGLRDNQVRDPHSLLALRVNGADLSPDHGYPARVIVPANPGVNNTKWVIRLTFGDRP
ncbi:molybdopterin-dependent oxidoreductase [Streptomyces sp. HNM0575]|uniref:molybdopterin-dependent oxidoreductase n=1 Tax=Streptomyces sp. HNM0575 TaxID=2716338 RepID=UPI00145FC5D8|nr:molybdopterin-dependent oxidoreductase [Streptomyces sp. HNM0575]NLU73883.1 molybdopterin-dependent oxidoreductase [Streptomyces sp. HNM0575]